MHQDLVRKPEEQLAQARRIACSSLPEYDLAWNRISLIRLSQNATFKIETEEGNCFLLRVNLEGKASQIHAEIQWLQALKKAGITAPMAWPTRNGSEVLEYSDGQGNRCYVTLMEWMEGQEQHGAMWSGDQAFNAGKLTARMHQVSAGFAPPEGLDFPHWGLDSFRAQMQRLKQHYSRFLSDGGWRMYRSTAEKIEARLASMDHSGPGYGVIHADLHAGNLVILNGEPLPIDFGRCGYGYYLYDVAGALEG